MKFKGKLPYIILALTGFSVALVAAAPKHTPQNKGGHGKTSLGANGGGQTNLARTGKSRNNHLGQSGQPDTSPSPTPTPTPMPDFSPTPGTAAGN